MVYIDSKVKVFREISVSSCILTPRRMYPAKFPYYRAYVLQLEGILRKFRIMVYTPRRLYSSETLYYRVHLRQLEYILRKIRIMVHTGSKTIAFRGNSVLS